MEIIIIIILFVSLIFRPTRGLLIRYARVIVPVMLLFALGYLAGYSFVRFGAPDELKLMGGIVFVIIGLKDVLKYIEEIFPANRK